MYFQRFLQKGAGILAQHFITGDLYILHPGALYWTSGNHHFPQQTTLTQLTFEIANTWFDAGAKISHKTQPWTRMFFAVAKRGRRVELVIHVIDAVHVLEMVCVR